MLFQPGDAADHFYIVHSGQLILCLQSRSGDEKIVATLSPGQAFARPRCSARTAKPETLSRTLRALADSGGIEVDGADSHSGSQPVASAALSTRVAYTGRAAAC